MGTLKSERLLPFFATAFAIALASTPPAALAWDVSSYAGINEDSSLRISGKTIHLHGIHIPATNRSCRTTSIPPVCGSRAAVALDFKIDGFVRCELLQRNADGSYMGHCRVNVSSFDEGEDLSAYLLERGWAVALPNAPIEYQTLEKIARSRGIGVWGIPVDRVAR
jgi:endonuclease YncB( thermonuclease family)